METKVDYGGPLQSGKVNKNVLRDTGDGRTIEYLTGNVWF